MFYAFTNDLPFQTEPCPHMNEGIRTEIREFLNSLENQHSGIKNNMYRSIIKISEVMKDVRFQRKADLFKLWKSVHRQDLCRV